MKLRIMFVFATLCLFVASLHAQQPEKPRIEQIRVIEYNGMMASLLGSLAESYGVIIGFEQDSRSPIRTVRISVRDATIRDALDAIVQNRPEYQWRDVNGVFEVVPVGEGSQLLETRILRFQVSNSTWPNGMNILMSLPEMQQAISSLQMKQEEPTNPSRQPGEPFSLQVENVTLRQVLNEMTRKSGRPFWHYSEKGVKPKTFAVTTN